MGMVFGVLGARMRKSLIGLPAAALAALCSGAVLAPVPVLAQQVVQAAQSQAVAFDIAAGPLPLALTAFGRQSGYQVSFEPRGFAALQGARVSGTMTPDAALRRLLAGTGVTFRYTEARSIVLDPPPQGSGATVLPPVRIEGMQGRDAETAFGPVPGLAAKRSATATKSDASLLETPQSVSVVSRENMETRNVQSVNEALRYSAGVKVDPYGPDTRHDWIFVRGFAADTQGLYVNGLRWQAGQIAGRVDPYGLERVEVLKGPASMLYGLAQPGGLVNLVTKQPAAGNFGEVRLEGGSFDRFQGAFDVNTEVDPHWQFRFTGLARDSDTQVDYVKDNRVFVAPSVAWRPNDMTNLTVMAHYQQDNTSASQFYPAVGTVSGTSFGKIPRNRFLGDPNWDRFDRVQYSAGYLLEHELNDTWILRQNLRYNGIDTSWRQLYTNALLADNRTISRFAFQGDIHTDVLAIDNQAQARFDTGELMQHTMLFGLDYSIARRDNFQRRATDAGLNLDLYNPTYGNVTIPNLPVIANLNETIFQTGIYVQDQVKIDKNWVLTLNGRQDWAREDSVSGPTDSSATRLVTQREDDAFTYRAGLNYLFDFGLAPYASYSTSFLPTGGRSFAGQPFQPTESKQYETGVKYQPPGSDSSVTASVFDLTQENVLTADPVNGASFQVQTGEIQIRGFELEAVANLMPGLNVIGAYTYLDAEITGSNTANERGKRPMGIAENTASLWGDYTVQAGDFRGFGFGAGVRYTGATFGTNANTFKVAPYTLYDAMVRYDYNNWRFAVNASNLFDQEYVSQCGSLTACYYGAGRTIVASLRYRW